MQMKVGGKTLGHALSIMVILKIKMLRQLNHQRFISSQIPRNLDWQRMIVKSATVKPWLNESSFHG